MYCAEDDDETEEREGWRVYSDGTKDERKMEREREER